MPQEGTGAQRLRLSRRLAEFDATAVGIQLGKRLLRAEAVWCLHCAGRNKCCFHDENRMRGQLQVNVAIREQHRLFGRVPNDQLRIVGRCSADEISQNECDCPILFIHRWFEEV